MKRYEKYILKASGQIKAKLIEHQNSLKVPEVYKGYIASFANSVRQSGLIAATSFYTSAEATKGTTDYRRNQFLKAIFSIIEEPEGVPPTLIKHILTKVYPGINIDEVPVTINIAPDKDELDSIQSKVEDASLALKLALRSFELTPDEPQNKI